MRALNETNRRLSAALADAELPAFVYNDLKREHLMRTGSVVLHELYFDNLGRQPFIQPPQLHSERLRDL